MFNHKTSILLKNKSADLCKNVAIGALVATFVLSTSLVRADEANDTIAKWPAEAQKAAKSMIEIHGAPGEVTPNMLVWHDIGPWKLIIASNIETQHNFPGPHKDTVEEFVSYKVPESKLEELALFDGSVNIDKTRGEMSARCDAEHHNIVALNLAHDIIIGKRSVKDARAFYTKVVMAEKKENKLDDYMKKLNFIPQLNTENPDKISPEMLPMVRAMEKEAGKAKN